MKSRATPRTDMHFRPAQAHPRGHGVVATAFAVSFGLHALVGASLVGWKVSGGVVAQAPEAVSINLIPSLVLEATDEQLTQQEAAASHPTAAVPDAPKQEQPPKTAQPVEGETSEPTTADAPVTTAAQVPDTTAPVPQEKQEPKRNSAEKKEPARKEKRRAKVQASKPHRRSVTAGKGSATHSGHVSAARGNIADYADAVRSRIARHKPGGIPHIGTATVSFAISPSGSLLYARLARSSGIPAIDAAAVLAVRSAAPFPPTPSGQRFATSIPFYFR